MGLGLAQRGALGRYAPEAKRSENKRMKEGKETPRKPRFRGNGNQSASFELIDPLEASLGLWACCGLEGGREKNCGGGERVCGDREGRGRGD